MVEVVMSGPVMGLGGGVSPDGPCGFSGNYARSAFLRLDQKVGREKALETQAMDLTTAQNELFDGNPIGISHYKVRKGRYLDRVQGKFVETNTLVSEDFGGEAIGEWTGISGVNGKEEYRKIVDRANSLAETSGNATMVWISPGSEKSGSFTPHRLIVWEKRGDDVKSSFYSIAGSHENLNRLLSQLGDNSQENIPLENRVVLKTGSSGLITHKDVYHSYSASFDVQERQKYKVMLERFKKESGISDDARVKNLAAQKKLYLEHLNNIYQDDIGRAVESIAQGFFQAVGNKEEQHIRRSKTGTENTQVLTDFENSDTAGSIQQNSKLSGKDDISGAKHIGMHSRNNTEIPERKDKINIDPNRIMLRLLEPFALPIIIISQSPLNFPAELIDNKKPDRSIIKQNPNTEDSLAMPDKNNPFSAVSEFQNVQINISSQPDQSVPVSVASEFQRVPVIASSKSHQSIPLFIIPEYQRVPVTVSSKPDRNVLLSSGSESQRAPVTVSSKPDLGVPLLVVAEDQKLPLNIFSGPDQSRTLSAVSELQTVTINTDMPVFTVSVIPDETLFSILNKLDIVTGNILPALKPENKKEKIEKPEEMILNFQKSIKRLARDEHVAFPDSDDLVYDEMFTSGRMLLQILIDKKNGISDFYENSVNLNIIRTVAILLVTAENPEFGPEERKILSALLFNEIGKLPLSDLSERIHGLIPIILRIKLLDEDKDYSFRKKIMEILSVVNKMLAADYKLNPEAKILYNQLMSAGIGSIEKLPNNNIPGNIFHGQILKINTDNLPRNMVIYQFACQSH